MITPEQRKWIENQLEVNNLKGPAAQKFTSDSIAAFSRNHKQPRKSDFATWKIEDALPGYQDYLKTQRK